MHWDYADHCASKMLCAGLCNAGLLSKATACRFPYHSRACNRVGANLKINRHIADVIGPNPLSLRDHAHHQPSPIILLYPLPYNADLFYFDEQKTTLV